MRDNLSVTGMDYKRNRSFSNDAVVTELRLIRDCGSRRTKMRETSAAVTHIYRFDVAEERQLWGEQYQQPLSDIFALQGEIAGDISAKLRLKLTGEERQRLTSNYGMNGEAYRLYLKGRYFWAKRPDGIEKAIKYFQQALELEPASALPWAGLADCYSALGAWEDGSVPPREVMPKALAAVTKAWNWTARRPKRTLHWLTSKSATTGIGMARKENAGSPSEYAGVQDRPESRPTSVCAGGSFGPTGLKTRFNGRREP